MTDNDSLSTWETIRQGSGAVAAEALCDVLTRIIPPPPPSPQAEAELPPNRAGAIEDVMRNPLVLEDMPAIGEAGRDLGLSAAPSVSLDDTVIDAIRFKMSGTDVDGEPAGDSEAGPDREGEEPAR